MPGSAVLGLRGGGAALRLSRTRLACGAGVEIMVRTCGRGRLLGVPCVRTLQFSQSAGGVPNGAMLGGCLFFLM